MNFQTTRISKQTFVIITAFLSLLAIVGFALYGLPLFYNFYIEEFGWSRKIVTSGNAYAKILVAPLFGFIAGWIVDKYGPKKMLMTGAFMTLIAFLGLSMMKSLSVFYISYVFVALGYVFGVQAQSPESIWLVANTTAYKTGETVIVTVNGSSVTPVQGFTFQIRYDPACLRPVNASSPITGMNGLPLVYFALDMRPAPFEP